MRGGVTAPLLIGVVLGVAAPAPAFARTSCSCGFPSYGSYRPVVFTRLDELPWFIREPLVRHIRERVGAAMFQELSFERGEFVERRELYRAYPEALDMKWTIPAYSLQFQLRLPGAGLYHACILLDRNGGVIQELTLPAAGLHPARGRIVTREEAARVAAREGVPVERADVALEYFAESDSLEWVFEFETGDIGLEMGGRKLYVPAHDPASLHWADGSGIR